MIKEWVQHLDNGFTIIVRLEIERGRLSKFVAVLMYEGEDITRFDNAHGVPHRDILGRENAFIGKKWYDSMFTQEALDYAIDDLSQNCQKYLAFYNSH
jgi:hypothetical protein